MIHNDSHEPDPGEEPARLPRPRTGLRMLLLSVSAAVVLPLCLAAWAATPVQSRAVANAAPGSPTGPDTITAAAAPLGPSVRATPPPASAVAPVGALNKALAATTVKGFLDTVAVIDPTSHRVAAQLSAVAKGAIVDDVANQQQELESNGWTQRGKAVVKSVTIISTDLTAAPPTAIAQACVDSSKVVTLDADGKPLAGTDPAASHTALNIYSLQQDGGTWRITARTFPDDPAC